MAYNEGLINRRMHGIVASRLRTFLEEANAARAAHPQAGSAQGHAIGKAARSQCYGAIERVLFSYLNYCLTELEDPAEYIDDAKKEIKWLYDEILSASKNNQALVTSWLEQFVIDAEVNYEQASTGRLNDQLIYRHVPWWARSAAKWFSLTGALIAWVFGLVKLYQAFFPSLP